MLLCFKWVFFIGNLYLCNVFFLIHCANLYAFIGIYRPLTFKVFIVMVRIRAGFYSFLFVLLLISVFIFCFAVWNLKFF